MACNPDEEALNMEYIAAEQRRCWSENMGVPSSSSPRREILPLFGPAVSEFIIGDRRFRLESWTEAQWERLPADRRPRDPWRHGDLIVAIRST